MAETRTRTTATPLYPGSFFPEEGRPVELADFAPSTALGTVADDDAWFALEVRTTLEKRWTDGAGGVMWQPTGSSTSYRIYVGETLTAADIERLPDADRYATLLANMRGNGWDRVVRTRRGNYQPITADDVVVAEPELAR